MQIEITGFNHEGEGVGRWEGLVCFVPGTVPGDTVEIEETFRQKRFIRARLVQVISPSADRVAPRCPVQNVCGGSSLHHIAYAAQLRLKQRLVIDTLERIGGLKDADVLPVIGMDNPYHYRNKASFHIAKDQAGVRLGFYEANSHQPVSVENCCLIPPIFREIARWIEQALGEDANAGIALKQVTLRRSQASGEIMVILDVLPENEETRLYSMVARLATAYPDIMTVILMAEGRKPYVLLGTGTITEQVGGLKYKIGPNTFFQTNTEMAQVLCAQLLSMAGDLTGLSVLDAYCGTGALSLPLAGRASRVIGVEISAETVRDANRNAKVNRIKNVEFMAGSAEKLLPELVKAGEHIDLAIVDPPRQGLKAPVIEALINAGPERILYVSCNPGTLARDLKQFGEGGYRLARVQPLDMFPHTPHVECVCLLQKTLGDDAK